MGKQSDSSEDPLAAGRQGTLSIRVRRGYGEQVRQALLILQHPDTMRLVGICETRKGGNWDRLLDCYQQRMDSAVDPAEQTKWKREYNTAAQLRHLDRVLWPTYKVRVCENTTETPCPTLGDLIRYFPSNSSRYDGSNLSSALGSIKEAG